MDPKVRDNHEQVIRVLRAMTPAQRWRAACRLSDRTRELFRQGLRRTFPGLPEAEFQKLYLERMALCHNRTC